MCLETKASQTTLALSYNHRTTVSVPAPSPPSASCVQPVGLRAHRALPAGLRGAAGRRRHAAGGRRRPLATGGPGAHAAAEPAAGLRGGVHRRGHHVARYTLTLLPAHHPPPRPLYRFHVGWCVSSCVLVGLNYERLKYYQNRKWPSAIDKSQELELFDEGKICKCY